MSLQTRLASLITAIGTDVKAFRTWHPRDIVATPASPAAGAVEYTVDGKSLDMKHSDGTVTRIGPSSGGSSGPLATAVTNTSANTVYPDNATYFRYVLTTDGFSVNGMLTGQRVGITHTQRLQDSVTGNTYARVWLNGTSAWSAWTLYMDAQDFDVKGDLLVGTGSDTYTRQAPGTDGQVLTADSTLSTGVKWATSSGGSPDPLELTASSPAAPAANKVRVFGRSIAGKMMPAFIGPSGLDSILQASFARNKIAQFSALPGSAVLTSATGMALTATGTATAKTPATTNLYVQTKGVEFLVTTAAATAVAGWRSTVAAYWRGTRAGEGGFFFVCRFGPATGVATAGTTIRAFVGFVASTAAPTDVNPSTQVNMCGIGLDSGDANWQFMTNDQTGVATKIDLGANFARATADRTGVFEIAMFCAPNGSEIFYEVTNTVTGNVATGSVTTDLPQNSVFLTQKGWTSVGGTSSVVGTMLSSLYIETDL